jgi:hypothetical protein
MVRERFPNTPVVLIAVASILLLLLACVVFGQDDQWMSEHFDKLLFAGLGFSVGGMVSLVWGTNGLHWPNKEEIQRKGVVFILILLGIVVLEFWWHKDQEYRGYISQIRKSCEGLNNLPYGPDRQRREDQAIIAAQKAAQIHTLPKDIQEQMPCSGR